MDYTENLFANDEIEKLTIEIAIEFENRNLYPIGDFYFYVNNIPGCSLNQNCFQMYYIV